MRAEVKNMNPQTKYAECDQSTTRAFLTMFREIGSKFRFAIDSNVDDDEEVRAYLIKSDADFDGQTTIGVTAINSKDRFDSIKSKLVRMGLEVSTEVSTEKHDSIGRYTAYTLNAYTQEPVQKRWNVPHMVVYGSLTQDVKEAFSGAFPPKKDVDFADVRNHYLVFGSDLKPEDRDTLTSQVQSSDRFFESDRRDAVSNLRTSDFV